MTLAGLLLEVVLTDDQLAILQWGSLVGILAIWILAALAWRNEEPPNR